MFDDNTADRLVVAELADDLGCRKQSLFKVIDRLGITAIKQRDPDRGNQLVSTVSSADAIRIRAEFLRRQRAIGESGADWDQLLTDDGMFYVIQLEPDHDPGRIKVGFTTDLDGRLQKHRCAAPFARYVRSWPCRRSWERAAIDCVTAGTERLHTEVFRTAAVDEITERADRFFNIMPSLTTNSEQDVLDNLK